MSKYLVCFKANYAYSESNFDRVVDWDGTDVSSLKSTLRDIIRDDYCSGKKVDVGITLLSVFELKKFYSVCTYRRNYTFNKKP